MNGNKIMLMKDGVAVAAVVTHDVQTEADQLEVAGSGQGQWREYVAGRKRWEVTANYLVVSSAMILGLLQNGQTFAMKSYQRDSMYNNVHGQAELQQCRIDATKGALVNGYFKFRGTQDLWAQQQGTGGDFNSDFNSDFLIQ
jgi:predicted secreted protein